MGRGLRGRSAQVDLLELEVFRSLFGSIAEEMGVLLQRSASSPNIKERRDFSCALFSKEGELFAQAAHIPVHLGSAPLSVRAAMAEHEFRPGDVVVLNDPFRGGTHLPDLTMVQGVFLGGRGAGPSFWVATRAHHADVGGVSPGSMAVCPDLYGEGLRLPPVLLSRDGRFQRDVLRLIRANVRTPVEREADLRAQVAANERGVRRLGELVERHGLARLGVAAQELLAHGERRMQALLRDVPDGVYRFADCLDDDGLGRIDLPVCVTLRVAGDSAVLDFAGTASQARGSVNANPAITLSAVLYVFQCLVEDDLPPNEGMARPLKLLIPPGSLLDPSEGAPMAGGNVETSQRIVDVVFGALAQALPERVPAASQGTMNNLTIGSTSGGEPFSYYETTGGGAGAGPATPGTSGIQVHMTNTWNTPLEALEISFPLQVLSTRLVRGSGGRGRQPGGDGIERVIQLLRPARVSLLTERRRHAPFGLQGGEPGRCGKNWVVRGGRREARPGKFSEELDAGDVVGLRTPGGGGHGSPLARKTRGPQAGSR